MADCIKCGSYTKFNGGVCYSCYWKKVAIDKNDESIKLNECQENAVKNLAPLFNEKSNYKVGIIQGSAGTGKTFLVAHVIHKLEEEGWKVLVLAPTGRASQVLADKMKGYNISSVPQTIHSYIYKIKPIDYSVNQLTIFGSTQINSEPSKTIFIIDEGSMIGDVKKEGQEGEFRLGSGSLLHDLVQCSNIAERNDIRLLFVGDPCQLPPIGKESHETPALDVKALEKILREKSIKTKLIKIELDEIMRQDKGTLLDFVTKVRDCVIKGEGLPKKGMGDVQPLKECDLLSKYIKATENGNQPHGAVILAHTNKAVNNYNKKVRQALCRNEEDISVDEILLVKRNVNFKDYGELGISNDFPSLKNGTFIQVVRPVIALKDKVVKLKGGVECRLKFYKARINVIGTKQEHETLILGNGLIDERIEHTDKQRNSNNEVAILIDFQKRMKKKHGWGPQKPGDQHYDDYAEAARNDKYMNALRVKYGYAVTVHNSQGGEWPIVFVDPASNRARDWQNSDKSDNSFSKWIYTASTRATRKLYFIDL